MSHPIDINAAHLVAGAALRIREASEQNAIEVAKGTGLTWAVDGDGRGKFDPAGWITPTLGSGVTNFNSGYGPVRYRRDASGIVHLSGLAAHAFATGFPGKTIFTLPDGYRPRYEMYLAAWSNSAMVQLVVGWDQRGAVALNGGSTWAALDGVSFPAEIYATVVCLGDSITNGFGATVAWPTQLQSLLGSRAYVLAKGVDGATLVNCEGRRGTDVNPWTPSYCILQAGVNDVMADASADTIISRLQTTANALIASGITPIIPTLLPWRLYTSFTAAREVVRQTVNAWLLSQTTYAVVDLETVLGDFTQPVPKLKAEYDSGDGLHPSNAGTAVIAQTIFEQAFDRTPV